MSGRRPSLALHLTLLFALSAAVVLVALGLLIAHAVDHHFADQDRDLLSGKLELTRHILENATRNPGDETLVS